MSYQDRINELKEILEEAGFEKYLTDFARILYKYIKDNDSINENDLKSTLESICTELDWGLTKNEILSQFENLVKERISMNCEERIANELTELDFLYYDMKEYERAIEELRKEYERTKEPILYQQLKQFEYELERIKQRIKELEQKKLIQQLKKQSKKQKKSKGQKIVIKYEAKPKKEVKIETKETPKETKEIKETSKETKKDMVTQDYYILLSQINELKAQMKELMERIKELEAAKTTQISQNELQQLKKDIEYIKSEFLNIYQAISLMKEGKKESEGKEGKKELGKLARIKQFIFSRKFAKYTLLAITLFFSIPFITPLAITVFGLFILALPLVIMFIIPYIAVVLTIRILNMFRRKSEKY